MSDSVVKDLVQFRSVWLAINLDWIISKYWVSNTRWALHTLNSSFYFR